jgi:hypothetical protein
MGKSEISNLDSMKGYGLVLTWVISYSFKLGRKNEGGIDKKK